MLVVIVLMIMMLVMGTMRTITFPSSDPQKIVSVAISV